MKLPLEIDKFPAQAKLLMHASGGQPAPKGATVTIPQLFSVLCCCRQAAVQNISRQSVRYKTAGWLTYQYVGAPRIRFDKVSLWNSRLPCKTSPV